MGSILGLMSTSDLAANRSNNARRSVFYDSPNAKAPLTGLLSLARDGETINDPLFAWFEESWVSARSITTQVASGGPFAQDAGANIATAASSPITIAAGTTVFLEVADTSQFRVRDVIQIMDLSLTSGSGHLTAWVTAIITISGLNGVLTIKAIEAMASTILNTSVNNGKVVTAIGTSTEEGGYTLNNGRSTEPIMISNFSQIFRTTAGPWTGTALQMGQKWDGHPKYKKDCRDSALRHMEMMEKAILYGVRGSTTATVEGVTMPVRFMGGVTWFLKQWELGNTGNGGAFDYRPSGSNITAADWTTEEDKRWITLTAAPTSDQFFELIRRSFVSQSDKTFEKLVFCGDKALSVITAWARASGTAVYDLNAKEDSYGLAMKRIVTPHGDWLLKTHPLFKENPAHQNRLMILDIGDISYHPMSNRDTRLIANRQPNNADYRVDEWLTEMTCEIVHPRRHMVIDNLTRILP